MGYFNSLYASELPHRAVAVYMYLKDRANKDGKCYPAIGTIARELKLSRGSCQAGHQRPDKMRPGLQGAKKMAGKRRQEQLHVLYPLTVHAGVPEKSNAAPRGKSTLSLNQGRGHGDPCGEPLTLKVF